MTDLNGSRNILALESAVGGGSVALICGEKKLIVRREGSECSRAEKLISIISGVLDEAGLTLRNLDLIAVSIGPGSYSGIRIGISTALGLGNALGTRCVGVSVLDAMAYAADLPAPFLVAVPVGKNDVAWNVIPGDGSLSSRAETPPELTSCSSFIENLNRFPNMTLFAHSALSARITGGLPEATHRVNAGFCLAEFVGRFPHPRDGTGDSLSPLYLRNRDAAASPGF